MTTYQFLTSAWTCNPWVISLCVVALCAACVQFRPQKAWLVLGTIVLFLTLCSPINALANGYLFSAHMLQHLLLLLMVPLLIILGLSDRPLPGNLDTGRVRWLNYLLRWPMATWLMGVGGMWLWHAPTLCNAAVSNLWVHRLQTVSLLAMGFAFWWPIFGPWARQRLAPLAGMLYLFTACLGCTILGIIITFSPVEVCSMYLHPLDRLGLLPLLQDQWGLTPAQDQQLGGLLMWVPACLVYFFGILGLLVRWYCEPGQPAVITIAAPKPSLIEKPHGL